MSIKLIFASTVAVALVAGTPAFAAKSQNQSRQVAAAYDAAASGGAKAKAERKKCRTFENTAMRTKRERLCLTAAEWKKFEEAQ